MLRRPCVQADPEEDDRINDTRDVEFLWHDADPDAEVDDFDQDDAGAADAGATDAGSTEQSQVC